MSTAATSEAAPAVSHDRRLALLRDAVAFASLPQETLGEVAASLGEERFAAGDTVIHEGEMGDRLYILVEGHAEASTETPGESELLASYQPSEVFGELALLSPDHIRHATVVATEALLTLTLDGTAFERMLSRHPDARKVFEAAREDMLLVKFLKAASPFAKLDLQRLRQLARHLRPLSVRAGEDIVRQGERGAACYLLRSGKVHVLAKGPDGAERQLATLGPGTLIGEAALLTEAPRNATARAVEPSELLVLHRSDLVEAVRTDQELGLEMIELMQLRDRPKQQPGVLVHQRPTPDGSVITTLKDTKRVAYYRLSPEGYFVWQRLDGHHTLRDLTLEYLAEFKSFAPQAIAETVGDLAEHGFLETRVIKEDVTPHIARRSHWHRALSLARHTLEWQISIRRVDGLLTRLYRGGIWVLYTIPAQIVLALVAVAGLAVFARNVDRASQATTQGGWVLLFFVFLYLLAVVLHESGHAFTVKAFGHEVPRAGVGWYYYGPIAYIDTSDMWLASRWPRIAVTVGGLYSTALVAGISSIAAALLGSTVTAAVLWQLAFVSYYLVLKNLNPLQEVDGYFILMDWLDRPNLREQCLAWLGNDFLGALRRPQQLWRHRLELAFGLASIVYVIGSALLLFDVYRTVIQGWLGAIVPFAIAAGAAWAITGTLVVLTIITLIGDLREARRLPMKK